jgi:hypothetical protein
MIEETVAVINVSQIAWRISGDLNISGRESMLKKLPSDTRRRPI